MTSTVVDVVSTHNGYTSLPVLIVTGLLLAVSLAAAIAVAHRSNRHRRPVDK